MLLLAQWSFVVAATLHVVAEAETLRKCHQVNPLANICKTGRVHHSEC
jgi:hypothetical protein